MERELFIAQTVVLAAKAWANRHPLPYGVTNAASLEARRNLRLVLSLAEADARVQWEKRAAQERVLGPGAGVTPITPEHAEAIRAAFPEMDVVIVRAKEKETP